MCDFNFNISQEEHTRWVRETKRLEKMTKEERLEEGRKEWAKIRKKLQNSKGR